MNNNNFKTRECEKFCNETIDRLPFGLKGDVEENHLEKYSKDYVKANKALIKLNNIIDVTHIDSLPIREHFNDERLKEIASQKVDVVKFLTKEFPNYSDKFPQVKSYIENIGVELSEASIKTEKGLVVRALNENWWLRQLRKTTARAIEKIALSMGLVCKGESIYCSNFALQRYRAANARNRKMMEESILENENGESFTLQELSDKTTANPAIRRMEFMTRIRGFEEYAEYTNKEAVFLTVTAPSKYHTKSHKYNGATPRETQQYLNGVWARTRAQLAREEIEIFGFRVAEPHHDGTPHGHSLLFCEPESKTRLVEIFTKYAMEENKTEKGAKENRVKVIYIDASKGSAVGYIAKYISKSIDGEAVGNFNAKDIDKDWYGLEAASSAERIRAWASLWGIRQFQQVGGIPVTIWRTLRNIETKFCCIDMESAKIASNGGEWDFFTRHSIIAGIKLLKEDSTGENCYGEPLPAAVIGVFSSQTGEIGLKVVRVWKLSEAKPWTCLNNCTPIEIDRENIRKKVKLRIVDS